ncbi:MAG: TonB-dependent receptor [candidate division Zixibacteria bacterium]|nr:TonB-dependent receptor [candidate division Zixibacteria bacterium]
MGYTQIWLKNNKSKRRIILFLVSWAIWGLIFPVITLGEDTGILKGIVTDGATRQPLKGVSIILTGTRLGTATDHSGYFQIKDIPAGTYKMITSIIGYKSDTTLVTISPQGILESNINLESKAVDLPAVVVSAERLAERSCVSDHSIERQSVLSREGQTQDPLRVIQTLPGVTSLGDLFSPSQIYVRGGGPEENLFLLDWTKVHWPWYFGGMKSVFNSEIIDKIELLTGGFPVKYGDCLSSVLNVSTREGNRERFGGNFSLGLANTQLVLEGPITCRGFFLVSGRRSYLNFIMGEYEGFPVPGFYDFNFKFGYEPWSGQKINLSGLVTNEKIDYNNPDPEPGIPSKLFDKGKINTQSLEWKHIISRKLYSLSALTREEIRYDVEVGRLEKLDIWALDLGFREDLTWELNPEHEIKTGFELGHIKLDLKETLPFSAHYYDPNVDPNDPTTPVVDYKVVGKLWSRGCYLQDSWKLTEKFSLTGGMRVDYLDFNHNIDFSPRITLEYKLNNTSSIRSAWGIYYQNPEFEHLSKNRSLESKKATHYILGLTKRFSQSWSGWIELYQKDYRGLVTVDTLENYSNDGYGYSRAMELFFEKEKGNLTGWISCSFGITKRKEFQDYTKTYSDFDQRHMLSAVLDWNFSRKFTLDLQFRYATGRPYTPAIRYELQRIEGRWIWVRIYGKTNSERYPSFHQLNFRLQYDCLMFNLSTSLYLEVWNLYNRKNVLDYSYKYSSVYENYIKKSAYHCTPFLPSLGFRINF